MEEKNNVIYIQTTPEMRWALENIAMKKNQSISSVVESIVGRYLEEHKAEGDRAANRRRLERKPTRLHAFIGEPSWHRRDFEQGAILDISLLGVRLSVPKDATLEIPKDGKTSELCIIFHLPDHHWPIHIKCLPKWAVESEDDIQFGAELLNHDVYAFKALQKYTN
ncbi:MAG: PilZ domain-containing protein [Deltaproteobacteria bacterium]|nr:PilZ domain-containing protein [Deltaproteobacteria bacterium]